MSCCVHGSASLIALRRTVPEQIETRSLCFSLEQVRADRLREDRIVDQQRDIRAGLFAGTLPSGADLGTIGAVACVNPKVRRVLAVPSIGRNEGKFDIDRERTQPAAIAVLVRVN